MPTVSLPIRKLVCSHWGTKESIVRPLIDNEGKPLKYNPVGNDSIMGEQYYLNDDFFITDLMYNDLLISCKDGMEVSDILTEHRKAIDTLQVQIAELKNPKALNELKFSEVPDDKG